MHVEVGNQDSHEFRLTAGQDAADLVLLIVQIYQSLSDFLLIFQSQRIRVVEIPGNGGLGKICIGGDIREGHFFFRHCCRSFLCLYDTRFPWENSIK